MINDNSKAQVSVPGVLGFLSGGGETGAMMRRKDWSATPLGLPEQWPQSLKTIVRIMLDSRYAMWMGWGPELTFFCNDAYLPTVGVRRDWVIGAPSNRVWEEIWPEIFPRIEGVLESGVATWDEALLLFLERSGYPEETYHTFSYSPIYNDTGDVGGHLCVVTEVTEGVIAERRGMLLRDLAASLAKIKTEEEIFDAVERRVAADSRDLPFTLMYRIGGSDLKAKLLSCTGIDPKSRLATATVWPLGEVVGTGTSHLMDVTGFAAGELPQGPWARPPLQVVLLRVYSQVQGEPTGVFVVGINPHRPFDDGYKGFVNLFVGQIAAALASAHTFEEEKKRADALAELDRAKTAFFSNVSHEFRTPITLMLGPLEETLSQANGALPELAMKELEVVHRNGLRLLRLVNTLLDFSRIEAGRVQASYEPTNISEYTAELSSVFRSAIEKAGLTLSIDAPDIGELVFVDRTMWEKIVLNLLSNAFKFTLHGEIAVRVRKLGENVELSVRDTGAGVAESELPRLFERFHRIEGTPGRTHEGTGIGLALVHELVKLHGGAARVESQLGKGTTFFISIPLGRSHLPAEQICDKERSVLSAVGALAFVEEAKRWIPDGDEQGEEVQPSVYSDTLATSGPRARIILADDNADMRDYAKKLLQRKFDVEAVSDGAEALTAIRRRRPALVLTDVMMPNLDGFGLLNAIRGDDELKTLPVIFLSARAGEESRIEGMQAGADDYVSKPFSSRELLARVENHIDMASVRLEASLREQLLRRDAELAKERAEAILESITDSFVALDKNWKFTYINRQAEIIFGVSRDSLIGMSHWDFFPEAVGTRVFVEYHRAMKERLAIEFENYYEPYKKWFSVKAYPTEDGGLAAYFSDITARKLADAEREHLLEAERAARAEAERVSVMKDEFLATLSHELRTPLNAILGWAQILRSRPRSAEESAEGLAVIERNTRMQSQLIEDLLDMSRITSGKVRLDVQDVDLQDVVTAAVASVQHAADARGVLLQVVLDPLTSPVRGDPSRLQQCFWNLLSNAIKFTPRGGKVSVTLERVNSHIDVSVVDNGQGIQAEFLPHIFERFRQADSSTTRRHGGLGLGLSIVKNLIELHGGAVRAESGGAGKGSTFIVELPVLVAQPSESEALRNHLSTGSFASVPSGQVSLMGIKVLAVDDEPDSRTLIKRVLEESGAEVIVAASSQEGLDCLRKERPNIIISDIGMPDEDGYEFIRKVRQLTPENGGNTPAAALTAFARSEDRTRAMRAGYQSHVSKPVEASELNAVVARLAERS